VLIPSATPDKSLSRKVWEKELCAHAIFNEYFVAGLNRTGKEGNYVYYGHSVAFDPSGEMLAQAGSDEEILIVDCDLDLITQRRRAWQFYRDRRPIPTAYSPRWCLRSSVKRSSAAGWEMTMRKLAVAAVVLIATGLGTDGQAAEKVRFAYTVQVHQANMMIPGL
jgi:hypothetical protein